MYQKPLSAWLQEQVVVQSSHALANSLRATHLGLSERIRQAPNLLSDAHMGMRLRDMILMEWIEAIPARVDTSGLRTVAARKRVVERACELMLDCPSEPMSILQVCSRIGSSPSKLTYCFRDVLGITPVKYLRSVRLNGVRRDLRNPALSDRGVQDVAARWGFWHLGEFSALYRLQFGELPSETLRSARQSSLPNCRTDPVLQ